MAPLNQYQGVWLLTHVVTAPWLLWEISKGLPKSLCIHWEQIRVSVVSLPYQLWLSGFLVLFCFLVFSHSNKNVVVSHCLNLQFSKNIRELPLWLSGKKATCQCRRHRSNPWVGKIPWRKKWQHTPVFLTGESHEQRSLTGYRPWESQRVGHDWVTEQQQQLLLPLSGITGGFLSSLHPEDLLAVAPPCVTGYSGFELDIYSPVWLTLVKSRLVRIWWNSFFEVRPCWEKQNALVIFQNGHPIPAPHQKQKEFIFNLHLNLAVLLGIKSRDMWCLSSRQDTMDFLTPKLINNEATAVHQWGKFPHPGTGSSIPFSSCLQSFPASGSFTISQFF